MSERVAVSDPLYKKAKEIAGELDVTTKEAISIMARDGGYDV